MAKTETETDEIQEAELVERMSLEYNAKDDDLISAINKAIEEAKPLKETADKIGKNNETYWEKGTDLENKTHPERAYIIVNRIFMAVETILSIITSRTPDPEIGGKNITNEIREKLIKALTIAYDVKLKVKQKLQKVVRHWMIYRIGVWKYRWDEGFILETVRPDKVGIDPRATSKENCEFVYELLEDKLENLWEKFPKKKKELQAKYTDESLKSKVKYVEFWGGGGEWVAWKLGSILLDKQKNPNFDYVETDRKTKKGKRKILGIAGKRKPDEVEIEYSPGENNLFKSPQFPYLFLNVLNLGKNMYDDTSFIEQVKTLQDGVNKRKNQISDLTDENKKVVIVSSQAMSKEEAQAFVNEYGMILIWLDKGDVSQIKVIEGKADASTFNDLNQSIGEIDNIMGTHSTTRGERKEQETLGGRKLLVAADYGRIEVPIENVEQLLEDLFNAYLHCVKVYGLEDADFSDGKETITLEEDDIPKGTLVIVKKGSTLPVDKASRAEMAIKLAQFKAIDPETLYEELGYPNAEDRVEKLMEWTRMQAGGEQGVPVRQGQGGGREQLARLQKILKSPEFKKLPPARQKEMIARGREIVKKLKGGATPVK